MELCNQKNIPFVFGVFGNRKTDYRKGTHLEDRDHLMTLQKSLEAIGIDGKILEQFSETLVVREVTITLYETGFRPKEFTIYTNMLDAKQLSKQEIAYLYELCWSVETNFRTIKSTLQLSHLRSQSPSMLEKELLSHFIAYNMVRKLMAEAAYHMRKLPRELSFKHALSFLSTPGSILFLSNVIDHDYYYRLLKVIAHIPSNHRPGRHFARKLKNVKNYRNYVNQSYKKNEIKG
jgi:hypothetical protein